MIEDNKQAERRMDGLGRTWGAHNGFFICIYEICKNKQKNNTITFMTCKTSVNDDLWCFMLSNLPKIPNIFYNKLVDKN